MKHFLEWIAGDFGFAIAGLIFVTFAVFVILRICLKSIKSRKYQKDTTKQAESLADTAAEAEPEDWAEEDEYLTESAAPVEQLPEKIEFAVFSPECITPKSTFILDVWAYLPNQYSHIIKIAQTIGRKKVLGRKTGVPLQRGAFLTIWIEISKLEVLESVDSIVWDGSPTNTSFVINVPEGVKFGSYPGKAIIGYEGITIAKIVFLVEIAPKKISGYTDRSDSVMYPRSAFASYASENRDEVLSRIQGMKKVAPDLDVFIDVFSLRSGQNWKDKLIDHVPSKDIFYLFWSHPASRSQWVEREWRMALNIRGINYIDPVPLVEPEHVPPPRELSSLHFNDAYVAYINYIRLKRQVCYPV